MCLLYDTFWYVVLAVTLEGEVNCVLRVCDFNAACFYSSAWLTLI